MYRAIYILCFLFFWSLLGLGFFRSHLGARGNKGSEQVLNAFFCLEPFNSPENLSDKNAGESVWKRQIRSPGE